MNHFSLPFPTLADTSKNYRHIQVLIFISDRKLLFKELFKLMVSYFPEVMGVSLDIISVKEYNHLFVPVTNKAFVFLRQNPFWRCIWIEILVLILALAKNVLRVLWFPCQDEIIHRTVVVTPYTTEDLGRVHQNLLVDYLALFSSDQVLLVIK